MVPTTRALRATVVVHSPDVYRLLVRERSVGLGQAYADGLWDTDDLVTLFRIGAREIGRSDRLRGRLAPLRRPLQRLATLPVLNTRRGARRNIAAHYDLGNEMFELFLDREWMMYSSALFERPDATLEEAQRAKLERICQALELGPDQHLLEIGTGWGGLALYAASRYGCRVTTTTISREQREYAEGRIRAAGLEERVQVLGADYRELTGSYDRLASIEMIEAVGWEYFDTFFERCSALLAPNGLMFLQAIAIDDRAYEGEKRARSFSNTLIFPGGCLPSLERDPALGRSPHRHAAGLARGHRLELRAHPAPLASDASWRHRSSSPSSATTSAFAASGRCTSRSRRPGSTRHACATCSSSTRSRRGRDPTGEEARTDGVESAKRLRHRTGRHSRDERTRHRTGAPSSPSGTTRARRGSSRWSGTSGSS